MKAPSFIENRPLLPSVFRQSSSHTVNTSWGPDQYNPVTLWVFLLELFHLEYSLRIFLWSFVADLPTLLLSFRYYLIFSIELLQRIPLFISGLYILLKILLSHFLKMIFLLGSVQLDIDDSYSCYCFMDYE